MQYAPLWRRLLAFTLDGLLIALTFLPLAVVLLLASAVPALHAWVEVEPNKYAPVWYWAWTLWFVCYLLGVWYFARSETDPAKRGATAGKRSLGIRVADTGGGPVTRGRSALRYSLICLPQAFNFAADLAARVLHTPHLAFALVVSGFAVGAVGLLPVFFGGKKQALHERWSGTLSLRAEGEGIPR